MVAREWPSFRPAAIDDLCELRGITRSEIARLAGISRTTLHWWMGGRVQPQYDTILRLCAALHVDPSFFAEGLEDRQTQDATQRVAS